jgi:predicted RND superfamily exporter protein
MYNSPRPFWVESDVNTFNQECAFDYASPSTHTFSVIFFWGYNIFNYQIKYVRETNRTLVTFLISLVVLLTLLNSFSLLLFGLVYLFQGFISVLHLPGGLHQLRK